MKEIEKAITYTTIESAYYVNFEEQKTCKDCLFMKGLGLDQEEDYAEN